MGGRIVGCTLLRRGDRRVQHSLGLSPGLLFVASWLLSGASCAEKARVTKAPPLPIVYVVPVARLDVPPGVDVPLGDPQSVGTRSGYDLRIQPRPELVVPERAVISSQGSYTVAVVGPDLEVELRKVELGGSFERVQIIRNGIAEGESVVVLGVEKVSPGLIVDPRPAPNLGASVPLHWPSGSGAAPE